MKGVRKVYLQTAIGCRGRYACARSYPNELPVTIVQVINNNVLVTFEASGTMNTAVLSDNGHEFSAHEDRHLYGLFLQLEGIAHKRTRAN